jgi:histidine triad (HIT) family protein
MNDCVFCKIADRTIPAYIFYEDEHTIAFLDIFPRYKYQSLVVPKTHFDSQFSLVDEQALIHSIITAQKVSRAIESNFSDVLRCTIAIEGLEIPHFHIRIEPYTDNKSNLFGTNFNGAKATDEYLQYVADKIKFR